MIEHLLVLHKFATVGLLDTPLHACDKAGLVFQHPANRLLDQLLCILSVGRGQLAKPRFDIRRKMYFHATRLGAHAATVKRWQLGGREDASASFSSMFHPTRKICQKPASLPNPSVGGAGEL